MWTKKSYDALFFWIDTQKREMIRKELLADGLTDIISRLDIAENLGEWYKITHEAAAVVGPGVIEKSAKQAEIELGRMASAMGRKGGSSKSERKKETARKNGKLGGRPRRDEKNNSPFCVS